MLGKKLRKFPHSLENQSVKITEIPKSEQKKNTPQIEFTKAEPEKKGVQIHRTAIVDRRAELDAGVEVGPFSIIESNVKIGSGTKIASNVLVKSGTTIGKNCQVGHGSVLGTLPQSLGFNPEEKTCLIIGDNNVIREYVTLNRGTEHRQKTIVGSDCFIMTYAHVGHDAIVGNHVIITNSVNLGGHVVLEDYVGIGGGTPVHQFTRIGCHAFVGGGFRVVKDIPPYILASGEPLQFAGLNAVGLKRRGFEAEDLKSIKRAYRIIYREHLNVSQAIARIKETLPPTVVVRNIVEFIESSERGIMK